MLQLQNKNIQQMYPVEIAELYNDLMSSCTVPNTAISLGHAMWYPYPITRSGEIRLGDLCMIRNGMFIPLLNANGPEGKSPELKALPAATAIPDEFTTTGQSSIRPEKPVLSSGLQLLHASSERDGGPLLFRFNNTKMHSAFMIPLGPVTCESIESPVRETWKKHFEDHYRHWIDHANCHLALLTLEPTDLFLVTGWVKTSHYVIGIVEGRGELTVSIKKTYDKVGDRTQFDATHDADGYEGGPRVTMKSGPGIPESIRDEIRQRRARTNQCLFLRGFYFSNGLFSLKVKDTAEPRTHLLSFSLSSGFPPPSSLPSPPLPSKSERSIPPPSGLPSIEQRDDSSANTD